MDTYLHFVTGLLLDASDVVGKLDRRVEDRAEAGEGVISVAIAVLIMAILGGLMFYAYKRIFNSSSTKVTSIVTDLTGQTIN